MAPYRPAYELVAEAAKSLTARGNSPFKLSTLIAAVQRIDPGRHRESIQPTIQGMTINAGKGPASPIGRPLVRVDHGYYELVSPERRRAELQAEIDRLQAEIDRSGRAE
jgi:hypothetical protein